MVLLILVVLFVVAMVFVHYALPTPLDEFDRGCEELAVLTGRFLQVYAHLPEDQREVLWAPVKQEAQLASDSVDSDPMPHLRKAIALAKEIVERASVQ